MRLETRVSELERERRKQPRSPEIKVIEIWEVAREFGEDGTEHMTEVLMETWKLRREGFSKRRWKGASHDWSVL